MSHANHCQLFTPEILRKIRRDLLLAWLWPARDYFQSRGLELPALGCEPGAPLAPIPYDQLSQVFLEPSRDMPQSLVDSVYAIH